MDNNEKRIRALIQHAVTQLALDTENPEKNYNLAILYESIGQTASAITYFFRAAERSEDKELAYECLLKMGLCYERQGNRQDTVKRMIQHALYLLPKRPEAYYLMSRIYERTQKYIDGYTIVSIGLDVCDFDLPPLRSWVEYYGKYALLFQKAVCGWWWGKNNESRAIFKHILEEYGDVIDKVHLDAINNNIQRVGLDPK